MCASVFILSFFTGDYQVYLISGLSYETGADQIKIY